MQARTWTEFNEENVSPPESAASPLTSDVVEELGAALEGRISATALTQRLLRQESYRLRQPIHPAKRGGLREFRLETMESLPTLVRLGLRLARLYERAEANAIQYVTEHRVWTLANLPASFDGYRILHVTDPHVDGIPDAGRALGEALAGVECDLCVFTGDYRFATHGDDRAAVAGMAHLIEQVSAPDGTYGVLGNHDSIEMAPKLERVGLRLLLNEAVSVGRAEDALWIAGVDDPHYYEGHDFDRACAHIPNSAPRILLAHSPEIAAEAAALGFQLYLCGHTHGGQICLPGGIPILTHSRAQRVKNGGGWYCGAMAGYTSRGAGASGVAARLFCPPEITIHELRAPATR